MSRRTFDVIVETVVTRERKVKIPRRCPNCKEEVTEEGLTEVGFSFYTYQPVQVDEDGIDYDGTGYHEYGESDIVTGYSCTKCSHVLVKEKVKQVRLPKEKA